MEGPSKEATDSFLAPSSTRFDAFKVLRTIRRLPIFPVFILSVLVVTAILSPWIAPHDPRVGNLRERNIPPAWVGPIIDSKTVVEEPETGQTDTQITLAEARKLKADIALGDTVGLVTREAGSSNHLLGTDHLGRDILSRIIHGARFSLIIAGITLFIGGGVGTLMGLLSGWYGGWVDEVIMRLVDIKVALPTILLALVLVVTLGQDFWVLVMVISLTIWPRFARMVRGEALDLKTRDYVALAQVAGAPTRRIIFKHLLPGVANTLIVVASLEVGIVILLEATLSFLGAGVRPPTPAWGSMVAAGRDRVATAWWISTMPGIAIMLTVMSLNLLGDWLRDTLDPRLRQLK